jgi:conjugative transfer signal peptidase TraF
VASTTVLRRLLRAGGVVVLGAAVLVFSVSVAGLATGYRVNVSPSVPVGLYRRMPLPDPVERGMLVILPVPASVLPWHRPKLPSFLRPVPLLKPIAAVAGDEVCVREDGVWVLDQWYGPVLNEAHGLPLPHPLPYGCATLGAGEVFVATATNRSLDSRYFGPVSMQTLSARAIPIYTWAEDDR